MSLLVQVALGRAGDVLCAWSSTWWGEKLVARCGLDNLGEMEPF